MAGGGRPTARPQLAAGTPLAVGGLSAGGLVDSPVDSHSPLRAGDASPGSGRTGDLEEVFEGGLVLQGLLSVLLSCPGLLGHRGLNATCSGGARPGGALCAITHHHLDFSCGRLFMSFQFDLATVWFRVFGPVRGFPAVPLPFRTRTVGLLLVEISLSGRSIVFRRTMQVCSSFN